MEPPFSIYGACESFSCCQPDYNSVYYAPMIARLKKRWQTEGGYREIISIALPLILSTGSITIQHFVDRMFLTWYSAESIAAAMPAGIINFTIMAVFFGTTSYTNTFVAQYYGAKRYERIGPVVWQGLYFSVLAGLIVLPIYPFSAKLFALTGHPEAVQAQEVIYFQILLFTGLPLSASSALAGFFGGRGKTRVIMWVVFASTLTNIVLDYAMIFGNWGFPEMGIRGAAIATLIAQYVRLVLYIILIFLPKFRETYHTLSGWRPNRELFARLLKFGFPNGMHYFLEVSGYTLFIILIGGYGTISLAAVNITFNLNHLAFMPLMGIGMALSIRVGHYLGNNQPEIAEKSTWSTFHLSATYILSIAAGFIFLPHIFLHMFSLKADPLQFAEISEMAVNFLKFVAVYCFFDMLNIIFSAAVKGAGDTRYVMYTTVILSWIIMVVPSYLISNVFNLNIYFMWGSITLFVMALGVAFFRRFKRGKWKSMRVIEEAPPSAKMHLPTEQRAEVALCAHCGEHENCPCEDDPEDE